MTQQEAITERLISVIYAIKMGQQSGKLTARRGEGDSVEEGMVIFVNGLMTEALMGRYRGLHALNQLCTWGRCRYIFLSASSGPPPPVTPLPPSQVDGPWNAPGQISNTQLSDGTDYGSVEQEWLPFPATSVPGVTQPQNGAVKQPAEKHIVPHPLAPLQDALLVIAQHGFSRSHRQLYLLIDGQRSLEELMRLMGRNQQSVQVLLGELEQLGVISIS